MERQKIAAIKVGSIFSEIRGKEFISIRRIEEDKYLIEFGRCSNKSECRFLWHTELLSSREAFYLYNRWGTMLARDKTLDILEL